MIYKEALRQACQYIGEIQEVADGYKEQICELRDILDWDSDESIKEQELTPEEEKDWREDRRQLNLKDSDFRVVPLSFLRDAIGELQIAETGD